MYFFDLHFYGSKQYVTQNLLKKESCIQTKNISLYKNNNKREKGLNHADY